MNEITLNVDSKHLSTLLMFLKTLDYIEIKKVDPPASPIGTDMDKLALLRSLYGAWKDERSAEAIIEDMHKMRHSNRTIEAL